MNSNYLNQQKMQLFRDKICEMFQEDNDSAQRRQQVSLNFTVTSRDSRLPNSNQQGSRTHNNFQANTYNNIPHKNLSTHSSSTDSITLALKQLDKFNNWFQNLSKNNQKLIDDLSTITTYAENNRSTVLTMPDFTQLKKRCSKSVKNCNEKNTYLNMMQLSQNQKQCMKCKKNDELIDVIQDQYKIKVDQCKLYYQKLEKCQQELQMEIQDSLRNTLIQGVQLNLLRQENQNLNSQLINLRIQLDKSKLQKSSIMQKSTTFLKTKDLEKRLEPTHTNSKLFSNAKYSTNTLNANDTMNRVQSIICFGDTQPNLNELIKFYGEQAQYMKNKCKQLAFEEEKKRNKKFDRQDRRTFLLHTNQNKLLNLYLNIQGKLKQVKQFKQKFPTLFIGSMKQKKSQQNQIINSKIQQQNQQLKRLVTMLQKQIRGLQNEKNNLEQTNSDIIQSYNQLNKKIKDLEQKLLKMRFQFKAIHERQKDQILQRKKLQLQLQQIKGSIRVYCRVRPRIGVQLKHKSAVIYGEDTKIIKEGKQFQFDYVFNDKSTQKDIYQEVKPLVQRAYDNKSLCIFAYGQTGSGKTYTMHGDQKNPGIALNIIHDLYHLVEKDRKVYDVSLSMSIVEIYKQEIRDLLGFGSRLQIKQTVNEGVFLEGCKLIRFQNKQQMLQVYQDGVTKRTTAEMQMNADSSRSHTIVTIYIQKMCKKMKEQTCNLTKITLIDLAGAERLTSSNPLVAKQTQFINKSLSSLVSVLSALKNKNQHIPYRDNKLTYLLKQSLSTKCNILTFINISASELNNAQTNNSLMFGLRARAIQRNTISKSKDTKQRQVKEIKQNKQNDRNRRSSARLSIS